MTDTLFLPLKKEWYNMIDSGVKTEEYRDITPYWKKRLECCAPTVLTEYMECEFCPMGMCERKKYVRFSYGYTKRTMTFRIAKIHIGTGNPAWGAPDRPVFIIALGERIS